MNTHKRYRILATLAGLAVILALTIGNVSATPAPQGGTDFAAIDAYVAEQMKNLGIPGMALGIVQDGQIAHVQGFGAADSTGRAVTPQTPFYIGSVTKSFTALAVMQLVEAGKVSLDAPVQTYLPWFELADQAASAKITVRHLLNQTTGISRIDGERDLASQQGLEAEVRSLRTLRLTQPVGTIFQYSNLNYNIAGLIIEQVSGQSYAGYVTQHIFEPLAMRHSYASRVPAQADGLSQGHHYLFGRAYDWELAVPPAHLPSGYLMASVEDLSHYLVAQLNHGRYGEAAILSPQGMAELHAPAVPTGAAEHYAMGWIVGDWDGTPAVWHNGSDGLNHSMVILLPERGSGLVLLANAEGFEQLHQVDEMAIGVANLLSGKPAAPVALPWHLRFLYWTVLLMPLLQIAGMAYGWRYWRNKGVGPILLTVMLYAAVALFFLFGVPQVIGSPIWPGIHTNFPELAYGLIAGAALGLGWSVVYPTLTLLHRKSKVGPRS